MVRQFPFSSSAQCMSVVVRKMGDDHFTVFVKGSPEKLLAMAVPQSVPADYSQVLERYDFHMLYVQ